MTTNTLATSDTNANTNADVELDFLAPFTYASARAPAISLTQWQGAVRFDDHIDMFALC